MKISMDGICISLYCNLYYSHNQNDDNCNRHIILEMKMNKHFIPSFQYTAIVPEQKPTQELKSIGIVFFSLPKCKKSDHVLI